ncbi:hypothetical protein PO124_00200 [Bacillus licheniformis]|nr:hypothetical protein [Bacillus licheniformis]
MQLGVAGQTFIYMFRFSPVNGSSFAFSASFNGLVFIWKRKHPVFDEEKAGLYCIIASMLLLSHVQLFQHLTERGMVQSPSVIQIRGSCF